MLKRIERNEAIDAVYRNDQVYLLIPAGRYTKLNDFFTAAGYLVEVRGEEPFPAEPEQWTESEEDDDEQPDEDDEEIAEDPEEEDETEDEPAENEDEPAPSEDGKPSTVHQKIVDMYLAGRTIKYIAQELDKSPGTVHYHLRKEGLV